jgi:hypothetical protein
MSDELVSSFRKLDRALPDGIRETNTWRDFTSMSSKLDDRIQVLIRSLRNWIAADEQFLDRLRPGGINRQAVRDNLLAGSEALNLISTRITEINTVLNSEAAALRRTPDPAGDLPEYRLLRKTIDATRDALEDYSRIYRKRANQYGELVALLGN